MTGHVYIIGDPVAHSLSPALHNAAFTHLGLDLEYLSRRVPQGQLAAALSELRAEGFTGANVTTPLKQDILEHLDRLAPSASATGAVNTVVNENGALIGHNTDGVGAVAALQEVGSLEGCRVTVLGAGGTARAICHALLSLDVDVLVVNRTPARAEELVAVLGGPERMEPLPRNDHATIERIGQSDVVVNATSVGMGEDRSPLPASVLHSEMTVLDCVYHPVRTRLLQDAENAGARAVPGTRMLLHQGAAAFRLWTGQDAPLAVMERALDKAVATGAGS